VVIIILSAFNANLDICTVQLKC